MPFLYFVNKIEILVTYDLKVHSFYATFPFSVDYL